MVKKKHVNDPPLDKEPISINVDEDEDGEAFEEAHVHRIYADISTHFSHTRYGPWKNVVSFVSRAPPNGLVLDVGCGNGKYLNLRPDCLFLGVDVCSALLAICSVRGKPDLLLSNNLRLAVRDCVADLTLSIAVVHHVSSAQRRLEAIGELIRCTRPGGKILIYVWSFEQDRRHVGYREFKSQDVLVPWNLQPAYSPGSKGPEASTYGRYYHVFTREEVDAICNHFSRSVSSTVGSDCNNWVIEMSKLNQDYFEIESI